EISNFDDLKAKMKEKSADVGLFYDGDADRCSFIDEKGNIVFPDMLIGILSKYRLDRYDDKRVYCDLRFSKAIYEEVKANGGKPIMVRVGNPYYKEKMMKDGGAFASEFSGHMMFSENYSIDDGLFAAVMILDVICRTGKKLSELVAPLQKYFQTEEINTKVQDADVVMDEAREMFRNGESIELDGVLIRYPDWWFSLRKSNTEPLVRLRIEADTEELLADRRKVLTDMINKHKQ
ncbi:hypothetical protein KY362_07485, partial [Candidatus Woesearchaeota archaeon]|nr:hypothetical protein [Candidatus Woesearchaeota archaeon]